MKKALILLIVIVLAVPSFCQEKPDVATEKNVLKVNPLSLIFVTGSVFYEHRLSDMVSGQFGFGYMGLKVKDTKFTGILLTPEVRIYPKKNAIDGFYIAPYLRYQNYSLQSGPDKGTLSLMGGGVLFGRQWIMKSGFAMDLFFGGHYSSSSLKVNSGTDNFDTNLLTGFGIRVGFALGFAF